MKKHAIILRLGTNDKAEANVKLGYAATEVPFLNDELPAEKKVNHQLFFDELSRLNIQPSNIGWDLLVLAVAIFSADTCIPRAEDSQDGWSREIELHVPVSAPELWERQTELLLSLLKFLTGDRWFIKFRGRPDDLPEIIVPIKNKDKNKPIEIDTVSLFSGGTRQFYRGNQSFIFRHSASARRAL